jgi:hypothetical protein
MQQAVSQTSAVTYLPNMANSEKFQLSKPSTNVPYWVVSCGSYSRHITTEPIHKFKSVDSKGRFFTVTKY